MSSIQIITNAKNGTTRSIYSVESLQTLPFDESYEPNFTDQEKIMIEGLAQRFEIDGNDEQLYQFINAFCVLADRPRKKTHSTGRVKKTDSVESKKREEFKSRLPEDRSKYVVDEHYEGWSVVKGEVGTVYFDGRVQKPDGKGAIRYFYTFEDACRAAEEIDCSSITLNESGYSLRIGQIPIKVGIGKKSKTGEISHPERQIMSWAKDSQYPLKYSRTEPVNDKRKAKSREAENAQSIIAGQLAELKALKSGKSVVVEKPTEPVVEEKPTEPVVEEKPTEPVEKKKIMKLKKKSVEKAEEEKAAKKKAEEEAAKKKAAEEAAKKKAEEEAAAAEEEEEEEESDQEELDVCEVSIEGEDYYWDDSSNKIFEVGGDFLGYYSADQTKITDTNELLK